MQKKIVTQFVKLASICLLMLAFLTHTPALVSAQSTSGYKCKNGETYPASAGQAGVTPETWCNSSNRGGLDTGGGGVQCNDGREVPLDSGISPADFCGSNGVRGMPSGSTGTETGTGSGNGTGGINCSFAQGGDPESCGFTGDVINKPPDTGVETCGAGTSAVKISFGIGCKGEGNGIIDMTLAILRFLSTGIGIIVVASVIVAGIQYTASRGNPQGTQAAIKRIQSSVGALLLFIFAYAFIRWVAPGLLLN